MKSFLLNFIVIILIISTTVSVDLVYAAPTIIRKDNNKISPGTSFLNRMLKRQAAPRNVIIVEKRGSSTSSSPSPLQPINLFSPVDQDFAQLNRFATEANFLFLNFPKPREE